MTIKSVDKPSRARIERGGLKSVDNTSVEEEKKKKRNKSDPKCGAKTGKENQIQSIEHVERK